jgi:3-hydroxyacyl-CoA dehydrogenase
VGAGAMGGEIAQTLAGSNIAVMLKDVEQRFVDQGLENARSPWQARVEEGKMESAQLERKHGLITGALHYDGFGDIDFVIEVVPERMETKQAGGVLRARPDHPCPRHPELEHYGLSITEIGMGTSRPRE